jgi:hypothetical protein
MKRLMMSVALVSVCALPAMAREVRYKDFAFELHEGDRVSLVGVQGSVKLISNSKRLLPAAASGVLSGSELSGEEMSAPLAAAAAVSTSAAGANNAFLRVRKNLSDKAPNRDVFDHWTFTVRREENQVRIEAKGPESKIDWDAQLKAGFPELHFELEMPPVPVELVLWNGQVQVQNWKSSLAVQVVAGQVVLAKNEGTARIQVQKGNVRVDGHKGRLEVDGFTPKMQIQDLEGDLLLDNFAGESTIGTAKGNLRLNAFSGQTQIAKIDGNLDFELGRATLQVRDLDGSLRGQVDKGSVSVQIRDEPDVNIEAQEGTVSLQLAPTAAPVVRLQTEDGNLLVPDGLETTKTSTYKLVAGRLKGGGKGTIYVKSKAGTIRVR